MINILKIMRLKLTQINFLQKKLQKIEKIAKFCKN